MSRRRVRMRPFWIAAFFTAAVGAARERETAAAAIELEIKSTAPAEITALVEAHLRRQLVRYRLLLPPHEQLNHRYCVELYGKLDEYRDALAGRGLRVANPACYLPAADLMLLGFDGARFDDALRAGREREAKKKGELDALRRGFYAGQKDDEARFRRENIPRQQREELRRRRVGEFQRASAAVAREIEDVERKNLALLDDATARLKASAAHELFHAYVADEAFPDAAARLPAWLNEGLAQVVERAQWSGDRLQSLRPDQELVKQLQADLRGPDVVALRDLLSADGAKYVAHADAATDDARRYYTAGWGLAHFLLADGKLADREALNRYVADAATEPVARFERWVAQPLSQFEPAWKSYVKNPK